MAGLCMLSSLFNSVVSFYLTSNISQYGFSVLYQVSSTRHHSRLSGSLNPRGCQVERSHSNGPLLPLLHHVHRQVSTFLLLIQLTSSLRSVLPYTTSRSVEFKPSRLSSSTQSLKQPPPTSSSSYTWSGQSVPSFN